MNGIEYIDIFIIIHLLHDINGNKNIWNENIISIVSLQCILDINIIKTNWF